MRALVTCLGIGMLLLSACDGDSKKDGNGGGGGSGGGGSGGGGSGGGSTITPQGSCANLTCLNDLNNLMAQCQPSGTCVTQAAGLGANVCYSNGVKMGMTLASMSPMSMTMTVKNGSKVCYSAEMTETSYVFKNGSGKTVATIDLTTTGTSYPITCADGTTGTLDSTCGSDTTSVTPDTDPGSADDCTQGTCSL